MLVENPNKPFVDFMWELIDHHQGWLYQPHMQVSLGWHGSIEYRHAWLFNWHGPITVAGV